MKLLFTDANPAAWAFRLEDEEGAVIKANFGPFEEGGYRTNNEAEYQAVIHALNMLKEIGEKDDVRILSDSKVVVNQLNNTWHIHKAGLRVLAHEIWEQVGASPAAITFRWIPRKQNKAGLALG